MKLYSRRGKQISFDDLARDYIKVTRLLGSRDLVKYTVHSQFLLFTQGKFSDAWNTVKSCLRIDNDFLSCGRLSKVYSKLQTILKAFEEYFMVDEFLYGGTVSHQLLIVFSNQIFYVLMIAISFYSWSVLING